MGIGPTHYYMPHCSNRTIELSFIRGQRQPANRHSPLFTLAMSGQQVTHGRRSPVTIIRGPNVALGKFHSNLA